MQVPLAGLNLVLTELIKYSPRVSLLWVAPVVLAPRLPISLAGRLPQLQIR